MAKVGIIMGSKSDLPIMQEAIDILNEFGIELSPDLLLFLRSIKLRVCF